MTFKKKVDEDFFSSVGNMIENFFNNDFFRGVSTGTSVPAVNIYDSSDKYELEVAAPGFVKTDFKLNLEGNILSISGEKSGEEATTERKMSKREFNYTSFKRSFTIPEHIDTTNIKATYDKGILTVSLPKKASESTAQNIDID
ncbi:MAG: Hsp20/alpha crystallin family protein [Bacteroidota bacterium]